MNQITLEDINCINKLIKMVFLFEFTLREQIRTGVEIEVGVFNLFMYGQYN